ncbi:hypothetical protein V3W47_07640 [Deinococcus sp. YIM 134068]|uniref:hypothetical protein n=1 Tax=Deinococcus lichenicola TaxID=3118910 RepID=UPI002F948993
MVRFGSLHWVDARSGAPYIRKDGRVMVPVLPACDLLGLPCKVRGRDVSIEGGRLIQQEAGFIELRELLEGHEGFTLTYDREAHMAVVGTNPAVNMVLTSWMRVHNDWGRQLRQPYRGPLFALKTRRAPGVRYRLSTTGTPLNGVTLITGFSSRVPGSTPILMVRGPLTPSLPDNPNRDPGCGAKPFCVQTIDREGLWMLAAVDEG